MKLKVLGLITGAVFVVAAQSISAAETPTGAHVSTVGMASIDATPDIAILNIMVNVSAKDAASAKKQADQRMAQYFTFLQKNGVEKSDVAAANLRTEPEYEFHKNGERVLKGFRALREVRVKVTDLDKLNDLLDGALKAELNEVNSIELGVAKPEAYRERVRQKAIDNAIQQAQILAKGFGAQLGPVYRISYRPNFTPPPIARNVMIADAAAAQTSAAETYQQQTIQFNDQVDVVFEMQPAGK